jgi:hypothetical protein
MTQSLSPRTQRIIVLGPTLVLSLWLSALGYPLVPRVSLSIGVGALLIFAVARYQRRRAS